MKPLGEITPLPQAGKTLRYDSQADPFCKFVSFSFVLYFSADDEWFVCRERDLCLQQKESCTNV